MTHEIKHGDYILREDIPDEDTFAAIVAECERQGIEPAGKDERDFSSEGNLFLLRGSIDLCQWSLEPWADGRRLTSADLGLKTPVEIVNVRLCGAEEPEEYDPVDRPEHYASGDIECIEAIQAALTEEEFRGYRKGSVIKYVWRERQKGGVESLRKARWHLDHLIAEQDE